MNCHARNRCPRLADAWIAICRHDDLAAGKKGSEHFFTA
jgi:hypothetical protein